VPEVKGKLLKLYPDVNFSAKDMGTQKEQSIRIDEEK